VDDTTSSTGLLLVSLKAVPLLQVYTTVVSAVFTLFQLLVDDVTVGGDPVHTALHAVYPVPLLVAVNDPLLQVMTNVLYVDPAKYCPAVLQLNVIESLFVEHV
jgi:hypothetical protein